MKIKILPKTKHGKYSMLFLLIAFILVGIINIIASLEGLPHNSDDGFWDNISLAIMSISTLLSAIISLIHGLVAIIKNKERSIIVYSCVLIGIFSTYFAFSEFVGEITNTH